MTWLLASIDFVGINLRPWEGVFDGFLSLVILFLTINEFLLAVTLARSDMT